jgi:hypothetical protein
MTRLAGERASGPQPPVPPPAVPDGVRASDAEREHVLSELGDGFVAGRLSHETFVLRVEATLRARHLDELDDQVADLPPRRSRARQARALLARARELGQTARSAVDGRRHPAGPPPLILPTAPRQRYTIGREWACDMSISHPTVSRWHADLRPGAGGWWLADLGSLNGTRLNGWRISAPVLVRPGDLVSFGTASFVIAEPPGVRGTPGTP